MIGMILTTILIAPIQIRLAPLQARIVYTEVAAVMMLPGIAVLHFGKLLTRQMEITDVASDWLYPNRLSSKLSYR